MNRIYRFKIRKNLKQCKISRDTKGKKNSLLINQKIKYIDVYVKSSYSQDKIVVKMLEKN